MTRHHLHLPGDGGDHLHLPGDGGDHLHLPGDGAVGACTSLPPDLVTYFLLLLDMFKRHHQIIKTIITDIYNNGGANGRPEITANRRPAV